MPTPTLRPQDPATPTQRQLALAQAIYSSADFEDKLDLLRARLPGRSSQELRQLLHQAGGEIHVVLDQVGAELWLKPKS